MDPIIGYVNILFLGGLIFAVGFVFILVAQFAKCRSPGLLGILGAATGLVTVYFSWVFFIKALSQYQGVQPPIPVLGLALSPGGVWNVAVDINEDGWWGPSGIFQWILVVIEAGAIVIGVGFFGLSSIDREVFCEDCNKWLETSESRHMEINEDFVGLEDANHLDILKLPTVSEKDYPRFTADVMKCPSCENVTAIRVKLVKMTVDKDGEQKEQSEDIPGIIIRHNV